VSHDGKEINKISVFGADTRFLKIKEDIVKSFGVIARETGQKGVAAEVYLVHSDFMDKNVLAFPAPKNFPRPDQGGRYLGEIYLNPDYIKKHGEDLIFMFIHGFLHLLGYDHKKKDDRIAMEKKERELLKKACKTI